MISLVISLLRTLLSRNFDFSAKSHLKNISSNRFTFAFFVNKLNYSPFHAILFIHFIHPIGKQYGNVRT